MRPRRFKADTLEKDPITVTGDEAVHALRVLRMREGDPVVLFDGQNREVEGRIVAVMADCFHVERIGRVREHSAPATSMTLIVATPKAARADWLVEKAAELGVARLWLLQTARGSVTPGDNKVQRWRRKATEASKQAGLAQVMEIQEPQSLDELGRPLTACDAVFYGEPSAEGQPATEAIRRACGCPETPKDARLREAAQERGKIMVIIGPEGGFVDVERMRLHEVGAVPIRFSSSMLRVETAAIASAVIWACHASE